MVSSTVYLKKINNLHQNIRIYKYIFKYLTDSYFFDYFACMYI